MKLTLRFVVAVLILSSAAACKKNHGETNSASVIGSWELYQVRGDIPTTTLPSGNGNILRLNNGSYTFYENGQLKKSGTYELVYEAGAQASVCLVFAAGTFTRRIIFDGDTAAQKVFIDVSNDELSLASGCFANDGGSIRVYKRSNTDVTIQNH